MKKFLIIIILLSSFVVKLKQVNASTGHDLFSKIDFTSEGKLLVDYTSQEIDQGYDFLGKRKFWGWKHYFFQIKSEAIYIGEVIFAKSNRTEQDLEVSYLLQEKNFTERSISVNGSISGKIDGKLKGIGFGGNLSGSSGKKETESYTRFEETEFEIVIKPNHRIIFHVTGDCEVSNGVSKYYVLGYF